MNKLYDIAIIGAGPAGLTAAIYGLRSGRSVVLIEKLMIGGQVALTQDIQNYPGYTSIGGFELSQKMHEQATALGAETVYGEVTKVNFDAKIKTITLASEEISAKTIIIATGARARKLNIANEESLVGGGVAYCAVCDGAFYKGKNVAVVGGGNSGVEDAIYLAKMVKHLTVIYNHDQLVAHKISVDQLNQISHDLKNITFMSNSTVTGLNGNPLQSIEVSNLSTGTKQTVEVNGLFIAIGRVPDTDFLTGNIAMNQWGYIITDDHMKTNKEGVYAAGDVRQSLLKQIVTATSDGALAGTFANQYLNQQQ